VVKDIEIDETEEFQKIGRANGHYPFPTVAFFNYPHVPCMVSFNSKATALLEGVDNLAIRVGKSHILFIPAKPGMSSRHICRTRGAAKIACRELGLFVKSRTRFRAYPYKGGIVIKRNEPLSD